MRWCRYILILLFIVAFQFVSQAGDDVPAVQNQEVQDGKVDVSHMLFGHIGDSYGWHITDWNGKHVTIPLPCIVYSSSTGWHAFMSSRIEHGHSYEGFSLAHEGRYKDKIVESGPD